MSTGKRIGELAKEKNISLMQIAKQAGISYNTLYSIVKRGSNTVSYDKIVKIANAMGISEKQILTGSSAEEFQRRSDPVEINTGGPARFVLLDAYNKLNGLGQRIAVERVKELAKIKEYQATYAENPGKFNAGAHEGEKQGDLSTKQEKPPQGEIRPNDGKE